MLTEAEEIECLALLEFEAEAHRRRPKFRGAARAIQTLADHEWIISGPRDTGKTWAAVWRLDELLSGTPKAQATMLRKVLADLKSSALQTYQRVIAQSGSGAEPYGGAKPEWYDYPNGARLWIGGMDRAGAALSSERDWIYVNQAEELALGDWETLSSSTSGRGAVTDTPMLFGDCNPGPPNHWIRERERAGALKLFESRHEDNPSIYDDEGVILPGARKRMVPLDSLTGIRYKRYRLGLWVSAEGIVYEEYDPAVHLVEPFEIPADWRRVRVIDFGMVHPFVCQWWAQHPDGWWIMYREIYMTGRRVAEHAAQILRLSQGERIAATICDHDAENRATLTASGIPNIAATKAVQPGIEKVQEMLAKKWPASESFPGGARGMMFMRGALVEIDEELRGAYKPWCTTQEFETYVYPSGPDGRPVKEAPVKDDDHGMDSARYFAMYASRPRPRFI